MQYGVGIDAADSLLIAIGRICTCRVPGSIYGGCVVGEVFG